MESRELWSDGDKGWGKLWPEVLPLPAPPHPPTARAPLSFFSKQGSATAAIVLDLTWELHNWNSLMRKVFCVKPWESGSLSLCSPPLIE